MSYAILYHTGLHEAKHAGAFFVKGIRVTEVCVREDGSGHCKHAPLDEEALRHAYRTNRAAALEMLLAHAAASLAPGLAEPSEQNPVDMEYVAEMAALWQSLGHHTTGEHFYRLANADARIFLCRYEAAISSMARQIAYCRYLSGAELQERLAKTFTIPASRTRTARPAPAAAARPVSVWDFDHFQWTGKPRRLTERAMYPNATGRTGGVFISATC